MHRQLATLAHELAAATDRARTLVHVVNEADFHARPNPSRWAMADFARLQGELAQRLERSSGHDLNRARVVSPFNARLSYNLYSCFRVLLAHERRHLRQAEEGRSRLRR